MKKGCVDIDKLIKNMTVDEKIGQLNQITSNYFGDTNEELTGPWLEIGLTDEELSLLRGD